MAGAPTAEGEKARDKRGSPGIRRKARGAKKAKRGFPLWGWGGETMTPPGCLYEEVDEAEGSVASAGLLLLQRGCCLLGGEAASLPPSRPCEDG